MTTDVRLVLCMIVKNEAAIIRRCLQAALPLVDACVVVDTGSTDATTDIVAQVTDSLRIPCCIARHDWQNFGHNRTKAARAARAWAVELGWDLSQAYLLFLDADMVLHATPVFEPRGSSHCGSRTWATGARAATRSSATSAYSSRGCVKNRATSATMFYLAQSYYHAGRFPEAAQYRTDEADGVIRTRNATLEWDHVAARLISEREIKPRNPATLGLGYADARARGFAAGASMRIASGSPPTPDRL